MVIQSDGEINYQPITAFVGVLWNILAYHSSPTKAGSGLGSGSSLEG